MTGVPPGDQVESSQPSWVKLTLDASDGTKNLLECRSQLISNASRLALHHWKERGGAHWEEKILSGEKEHHFVLIL